MNKGFPSLKTNRLLLRQFSRNDLTDVFKGLSNPQVIKYYGVSYDTLEATNKQLMWFADLEKAETGIWWAICSLDNALFYGAGGLNNISKEHKKSEIGFWLLPEYWKTGVITEAVPFICDYGFDMLHLHRIEAFVETKNQNCKSALTKLDFKYEGTMRDCEIKDEQFISLEVYAKFNDQNH